MAASPPVLQIHLLLNVLNRFAFIPGLGEREQSGIECLGDYLVAAHRLQTVQAGPASSLLRETVASLLALNQWLREEAAPTVSVHCSEIDDERLSTVIVPLASRLQAALMLLDGRPIRQVEITLADVPNSRPPTMRIVVGVGSGLHASRVALHAAPSRDGLEWTDVEASQPAAISSELRFDLPG